MLLCFFKGSGANRGLPVLPPSFPTRRSSDLCEEKPEVGNGLAFAEVRDEAEADVPFSGVRQLRQPFAGVVVEQLDLAAGAEAEDVSEIVGWGTFKDRKSTRLNSSH